jgi:hypothetical protein
MLTVRPLYCPAAGVPSTAQASRMRGRRHAAASHFQHLSASTAQSLLPDWCFRVSGLAGRRPACRGCPQSLAGRCQPGSSFRVLPLLAP